MGPRLGRVSDTASQLDRLMGPRLGRVSDTTSQLDRLMGPRLGRVSDTTSQLREPEPGHAGVGLWSDPGRSLVVLTVTAPPLGPDHSDRSTPDDRPNFEPVAVERRYSPPVATIDPDPSKGWLRRIKPVVLAHRVAFGLSIGLALISMLLQVAIPAVIRAAIDQALTERNGLLTTYVVLLLGLGLTRALVTFGYRYGLYRNSLQIDTDLRTLLYDHLTTLSFSFYDRTQSGQVISRANSDIRSVQMFLTFAPLISMTGVMFAVALGYMLTIHVGLTIVAILPLPGVFVLGKRLRDEVFPLSWIVQARTADVATIVDENVNGVRVVRSFAAERHQINELAKAATRLQWAAVRTVDSRARWNPFIENLPRIGTLLVLVYGGWLVIDGQLTEGTLFAFTAYVTLLQAPFRLLGLFLMLGQRAKASAG